MLRGGRGAGGKLTKSIGADKASGAGIDPRGETTGIDEPSIAEGVEVLTGDIAENGAEVDAIDVVRLL